MIRWLTAIALSLLVLVLAGAGAGLAVLWHYGSTLPDYQQLADYEPPTVTRVHAGDGRLLAEFAREKRVFVPVAAMPKRIIKAFLSAEDKNFYSHPGIDFLGVARAIVTNLSRMGTDQRPVGASTITQQVAKNFLLTNEVSIERKIKEAILAFRIERALSKERILELYLNEIYLGYGSYGVAAAALNYFNKALDDLTVPEAAFLAGLPKAPANYNPVRRPAAARARRDYVIGRMAEDGYLTAPQAEAARAAPLEVRRRDDTEFVDARFFSEEVRRELIRRYGEEKLYGGGLSVRTTLDPALQALADDTLRAGLIDYDRRHGWRGPVARIETLDRWETALADLARPDGLDEARPSWRLAVVLEIADTHAGIGTEAGRLGYIPLAEMKWAREWREGQRRGPSVTKASDVLKPGDVVLVSPAGEDKDGKPAAEGAFALEQIPEIQGALVAMDPHTGRVLAMTGGFSYGRSEFNRATQARRQPGSAFKPFVYLAALDAGFTPSSLVLDAPFVIDQGPGLGRWKPSNYSNRFYGPSPMRIGIENSRNLMTVRLAQNVGIDTVARYAERFGVVEKLPHMLSMALGAAETTVLNLTTAYAMLVNGGKRVTPTLIDRVQDRHGRTGFRHETRPCDGCRGVEWQGQPPPAVPDNREQVADPRSAYQIVSMLQGVVERGTGRRIRAVGKPLAGKTGTTNDGLDAWFIGFSPDLVVGVFAGFDSPRSLGRDETGSSVAVPIFRDFMEAALKERPSIPFRIPPGLRMVRVNADTGLPARPGDRHVIREAFRPGTEPTADRAVLDGSAASAFEADPDVPNRAGHGLY
jgi:penicillin-binding protein 1A